MNKSLITLVLTATMLGSAADQVSAETRNCRVAEAGSKSSNGGRVEVLLRCGGKSRRVSSSGKNAKELLAVALTAMLTRRVVRATYQNKKLNSLIMK